MIVQKRYRESVSPDPAVPVESGLLAMVDGVYIALEHAKRYDTLVTTRALDSSAGSVLVADAAVCSHLSEGERQVCAHR